MKFVTLDECDQHCKTDGEDLEMLTVYADAAEASCIALCNRAVFVDAAARDAALDGIQAGVEAARTQYDEAVTAAEAIDDAEVRCYMLNLAKSRYDKELLVQMGISQGVVAGPDFKAAVLLTVGHLYRNREDVVTGSGAGAVALPRGARDILQHYLWPGEL